MNQDAHTPPKWILWLVSAAVAVVVAVVSTSAWVDSKIEARLKSYVKLEDARPYFAAHDRMAKDVAEIKTDTKITRDKVVELRVLLAEILGKEK